MSKKSAEASNVRQLVTHRERVLNSIREQLNRGDDPDISPDALDQIENYLWEDHSPDNDFARQHLLNTARVSLTMRTLLGIYSRTRPESSGAMRAADILTAATQ